MDNKKSEILSAEKLAAKKIRQMKTADTIIGNLAFQFPRLLLCFIDKKMSDGQLSMMHAGHISMSRDVTTRLKNLISQNEQLMSNYHEVRQRLMQREIKEFQEQIEVVDSMKNLLSEVAASRRRMSIKLVHSAATIPNTH